MPVITPNDSFEQNLTRRQTLDIQRRQLVDERSSFIPHWRELGEYFLPRRPRFTVSDGNKGDKRNAKIVDSTGPLAARTLRGGMHSGITSPARPWFRLGVDDTDMMEFGPVKEWLHAVTQGMNTMFGRTNLYTSLPTVYGDIGVFSTAAMLVEEDFDNVLRTYPFAVGSYCISNNEQLRVDVFEREWRMTVRQLVMKFGQKDVKTGRPMWELFSNFVKTMWDRSEYETWVDVCHFITPNVDHDPSKLQSKHKKYASTYYEMGSASGVQTNYMGDSKEMEKFLRLSGYDLFPVLAPRWEVNGEDVYGIDSPGMISLGDNKQLQKETRDKAQSIEKMHKPPMTGPTSMKNSRSSVLAGDCTYVDEREGQKGFRPAYEVDPRINELKEDIREIQGRIQRAFYEDLFLMLAQSDRREITAREIEERHEEKLLALGPVLEQFNQDFLDPLIDLGFEYMNRQGLIPPPPPELQGRALKVEYVSIMAAAQKLVGIGGLERHVRFVGELVAQTGDISHGDKLDVDQAIEEHAAGVGVPPRVTRSDDKVAQVRADRAQAQQAQAAAANLKDAAGAAKNLAGADLSGDNALARLLAQAKTGQLVQQ